MGFCDPVKVVKLPITIGTYPIQNVEPFQTLPSAPPEYLVFENSNDDGKDGCVYRAFELEMIYKKICFQFFRTSIVCRCNEKLIQFLFRTISLEDKN